MHWADKAKPVPIAFFLLWASTATRQTPRAAERPPEGPPPLQVAGRSVEATVTAVSEKTLRFSLSPLDDNGTPAPVTDEPALAKRVWPAPALSLRSISSQQTLKAGGLVVTVVSDALVCRINDSKGRLIQELRVDKETGALRFALGRGPLFGLGQGGVQFDRRGNKHLMLTGAVNLALNGMRVPVPWLVGTSGWGLYVNRPRGEFDLSEQEGRYTPFEGEPSAGLDVFVVAGDPGDLMTEYARLTGFPTMPPLWTLGYQQSHRTVADRTAMFKIANQLREKKLPCDALIYLGTGWCPSGWNTWHGSFNFNEKVFPEPERDIKELHSKNFKVILHVVGEPQRLFGLVSDAPATVADPNEITDYWRKHNTVSRMGVDGWWPDVGERLSDASRLARIRMYWEGSQRDHPNVRPYALHRTGYAGMQRFGGWLWSGDVNSTWDTLRTHVAVGINTSLSGVPHWGTDIGGFYSTKELTGELFVRWFQFGAFCPLFRSHGRPSQTRLPWGWNTGEIGEPEMDGAPKESSLPDRAELRNPQVEPICQKYLHLRYRLMPYLYSLVRETHETGMPIMRALWLHYSDDPNAVSRGDEYLWGRNLLVAPVVEKGATARRLYLPRGTWYDFWTEAKVEGGREISRDVDLETIPLYVRAGTILPLGPVKQYTGEASNEPTTLVVYPGAEGQFVLYEDDGTTFDFDKGEFMKILCEWKDSNRQLILQLETGSKLLPPRTRKFKARVATSTTTRDMIFDGKLIKVQL